MAVKREEQLKEITERLEQGVKEYFTDENYAAYLNTMAQFHDYSFNNTLLIAMQKPEATLVAGYQAWQKKFHRHVKKGEKGIQIIAPAPIREKEEVEKIDPVTQEPVLKDNGQPETEIIETVIPRFRAATVFDVSQTEGEPLPEIENFDLSAGVENYEEFMEAITQASPVPIRFAEIDGDTHGYYHQVDKEIVIKDGMSESQTMKTAIHEVVHAKLHDRELLQEQGLQKDKLTKEVEAESTAYVVCQYFGLDTSDYSFPYIAGWSSDRDMKELRTSMDTIRKMAGELIETIGENLRELMQERSQNVQIEQDTLIFKISGGVESEDSYHVVKNLSKEELLALLGQYQGLDAGEAEDVKSFLQERGAELIAATDMTGYRETYPIAFYDVEYDPDTGIHDVVDLPAMGYAAMLIERMEYNQTVFTNEERNLIVNYAFKLDDKNAVQELVSELKDESETPDFSRHNQVIMAAQAEIDALPDAMVGLSEMHQYGYHSDGILPLGKERAAELSQKGYEILVLHQDDTEAIVHESEEMKSHDGLFGIEKETWKKHLEQVEVIEKAAYREIELFGIPALFSNVQVNDAVLPEGIFHYDLRGADNDHGNPIAIEKNVFANRAASVLIAAELLISENGKLWLGDEFNFTGEEITIPEYQQEMRHFSLEEHRDAIEKAIDRANENLLLSGNDDKYALYQISSNGSGSDKMFMNMKSLKQSGQDVDGAEYDLVYSGRLTKNDDLESIFERFNIDRPTDFYGHSLSVSDVIVTIKRGKAEAHFVDSIGFTELPDFVRQHLQEVEMNRKWKYAAVTIDTSGIEIEQHEGLWHAVDSRAIRDEIFYLMQNDTYGASVAGVIVNSEGDLVAQELENGFDQGAIEAIREYFAEKGITWEPEMPVAPKVTAERIYPPVYPYTLTYAMEHAAADDYLDSKKLNIDCKNAIEHAISENFDGMYLNHDAARPVLDAFGAERVNHVLAATVQLNESDGRFSRENKEWARAVGGAADIDRYGVDRRIDYYVTSHPAVLDGFIGLARDEIPEQIREPEKAVPFIRRYYVVEDLQKQGALEVEYYEDFNEALQDYYSIENHKRKAFGVENSDPLPGSLDFIQCKNGIDGLISDYLSVEGWDNPEVNSLVDTIKESLSMHDMDIAYAVGDKYFTIQTVSDGYDYTFYDNKFHELDGGVYDNPDIPIEEAMEDILSDEGLLVEDCRVIDREKLEEDVEVALIMPRVLEESEIKKYDGVAFKMGHGYLTVQAVKEGFDYVVYDSDYKEIDGGVLEEPGITIYAASHQICKEVMGSDTKLEPIDFDEVVKMTLEKSKEGLQEGSVTPTSEIGRPEAALNGLKRAEIEETVLCLAQAEIDERGLTDKVKLIGARVYGSRTREGLYKPDSDIDVVLSYKGEIREDDFFHALKESGMKMAGMDLDINPISMEKTGTLEAYLKNAEKYLDEKEAMAFSIKEYPEGKISFFFAECREFPILGEFHEDISLKEAAQYYNQIPSDRLHGIKGIGFRLEDGSIYDGTFDLFSGGEILYDELDLVPYYRDHPLVQEAIGELKQMIEKGELQAKRVEQQTDVPEPRQEEPAKTKDEDLSKNAAGLSRQAEQKERSQQAPAKKNGSRESVLKALRERQAKIKETDKSGERSNSKEHKKGDISL